MYTSRKNGFVRIKGTEMRDYKKK